MTASSSRQTSDRGGYRQLVQLRETRLSRRSRFAPGWLSAIAGFWAFFEHAQRSRVAIEVIGAEPVFCY
ncbi:MAG: hypothetical protein AAF892_02850 [Cyanobacteria bacterium P01_D01_bin.71]